MSDTFFSSGTANGLHITNWGGAITSQAGNIVFEIAGKIAVLTFPEIFSPSAIASDNIEAETPLPVGLRPIIPERFNLTIQNMNIFSTGELLIDSTTGTMTWFSDLNGNIFNIASAVGFRPTTLTYIIP